MLQTVEGIYRNGLIQLNEIPDKITESKVLITFIDSQKQKLQANIIQFGMFSGINQSTEEDFKDAEFSENFDNN
jgi:hypothetical protein